MHYSITLLKAGILKAETALYMKQRKKRKGALQNICLDRSLQPYATWTWAQKQSGTCVTLWFNIRIPKAKCTYGLKRQMSSKCSIQEHKNAVWTVVATKRDVQYLKIQLLHRSSMSPRFTINALKQKEKKKLILLWYHLWHFSLIYWESQNMLTS